MTEHANETMRELDTEELTMVGGSGTDFNAILKRIKDLAEQRVREALENRKRFNKRRR